MKSAKPETERAPGERMEMQSQAVSSAEMGARWFSLSRGLSPRSRGSALFLQLRFPWTIAIEYAMQGDDCPHLASIRAIAGGASPRVELDGFEGVPLAAIVDRQTPEWEWSLAVLRQAAAALDHLHACGLTHGALTPSSILVGDGPSVRIVDWMIGWNSVPFRYLSDAAAYLSPERLANRHAGERADQFALAAIAHRLLVGRDPFTGAGLAERLFRIRYGMPDQNIFGETSFAAHLVYDRAFSVEPADRYESCAAMIRELEAIPQRRTCSETRLIDAEDESGDPRHETASGADRIAEARPAGPSFSAWWTAAAALALLAFGLGLLNWRTQDRIDKIAAQATRAAGNSGSLENGAFRVCNLSPDALNIRELAVAYWNADHKLSVFNSTRSTQSGWVVAPGSSQALAWPLPDGHGWDGSVLFYFARVQQGQKEFLVSGRWDGSVQGCLHL